MRGSVKENLWSSIAREYIYKVACALSRARHRACLTTPLPIMMIRMVYFSYLSICKSSCPGGGFQRTSGRFLWILGLA